MLLGLDHAIIAVRDLTQATGQVERALGLTVAPGGEHPGAGTHNAIIRFGTEYLELISVRHPTEAASTPRGQELISFLARGEGLLGFALGSDDLDRDMAEASARGLDLEGPFPGTRRRPDGTLITWRTARVLQDPWGRRVPFLIQHDTTMEERRSWAPARGHPLGAKGVPKVAVAVASLDHAMESYRRLLGAPPDVVDEVPALAARRARYHAESLRIDLLAPTVPAGDMADYVRLQGGGLFQIALAVPNLERAVRFLRERGTAVGDPTPDRCAPLLDPSQTLGARIELVEGH